MTLLPDQARCNKCHRLFASGDAFLAHEGSYGKCVEPIKVGLVLRDAIWGFPGKHPEHKPRKSQAQAAMERLVAALPASKQRSLAKDIEKIQRVLDRERNR